MAIAESYATQAEIEARAGLGVFSTTTRPTLAQATAFATQRAGELFAVMSKVLGDSAPGPASSTIYSPVLVITTSRGYGLSQALAAANAIAAAADAIEAAGAGESPEMSSRAREMLNEYRDMLKNIEALAAVYPSSASAGQVDTHLTSGLVRPSSTSQATDATAALIPSAPEW